jgi:hypothetical protein
LGPIPDTVINSRSSSRSGAVIESIQRMDVFANMIVGQQPHRAYGRGAGVVTCHWDEDLVTDTGDIEHHAGR